MKYIGIICLVVTVLAVVLVQSGANEDAKEERHNKRLFGRKLTKVTLKVVARLLRRNRTTIRKALSYLNQYYGGAERNIDDVIDVIIKVSDRLDAMDVATASFFVDVAASLGLGRDFGLAVYNIIKLLI